MFYILRFLLFQERSSYLEYQKLTREIQHLSRLYVAWLFVCAEETKKKSAENLNVMQDNIAKKQASIAENETKLQELTDEIHELQKKKDQVEILHIVWHLFFLFCFNLCFIINVCLLLFRRYMKFWNP